MSFQVTFGSLSPLSAFSPAPNTVGATSVYIKKENFICPKVGVDGEEGIFYPDDRVVSVKLPEKFVKKYAR